MDVKQFENNRWTREDQKLEFRHKVALSLLEYGNVLDLGSGDGLMLSLLKGKGIEGRGLDISDEGVSKANSKGLVTEVFDFSSKPLPFGDESFDAVLMLDILEHLYNPQSVLLEAARVSKGAVMVGVPNFSSLPARLQMLFGKVPENNQPKKGHVYWFNRKILLDMAQKTGLVPEVIRSNVFWDRVPVLNHVMRALCAIFPSAFSLSFVVKFKKA